MPTNQLRKLSFPQTKKTKKSDNMKTETTGYNYITTLEEAKKLEKGIYRNIKNIKQ